MTDVSHGAHAQPKGVVPHSKLSLAKLIELRRRSRIDRARQLASNIETQAQILRSTQLYNLEAARLQLDKQLGGIGQNIPQVARAFHDARLATLTEEVAELQRQQRESATFVDRRPAPARRPGRSAGARLMATSPTTRQVTVGPMDAYLV